MNNNKTIKTAPPSRECRNCIRWERRSDAGKGWCSLLRLNSNQDDICGKWQQVQPSELARVRAILQE